MMYKIFNFLENNNTFDLNLLKKFIDSIPRDITKIKQYAIDIINKPVDENMKLYHFLFLQSHLVYKPNELQPHIQQFDASCEFEFEPQVVYLQGR